MNFLLPLAVKSAYVLIQPSEKESRPKETEPQASQDQELHTKEQKIFEIVIKQAFRIPSKL